MPEQEPTFSEIASAKLFPSLTKLGLLQGVGISLSDTTVYFNCPDIKAAERLAQNAYHLGSVTAVGCTQIVIRVGRRVVYDFSASFPARFAASRSLTFSPRARIEVENGIWKVFCPTAVEAQSYLNLFVDPTKLKGFLFQIYVQGSQDCYDSNI